MGKRSLFTRVTYTVLTLSMVHILTAQIGGRYAFESLNLPNSARLTALGGSVLGVADDDVALAAANPASLDSAAHRSISLNHNFHFADIGHGYGGYGHYISRWGIMTHAAFMYLDFGDFILADDFGTIQGDFSGRETALMVGASKVINEKISVGSNINGAFAAY